jgi:hypothetical protein
MMLISLRYGSPESGPNPFGGRRAGGVWHCELKVWQPLFSELTHKK